MVVTSQDNELRLLERAWRSGPCLESARALVKAQQRLGAVSSEFMRELAVGLLRSGVDERRAQFLEGLGYNASLEDNPYFSDLGAGEGSLEGLLSLLPEFGSKLVGYGAHWLGGQLLGCWEQVVQQAMVYDEADDLTWGEPDDCYEWEEGLLEFDGREYQVNVERPVDRDWRDVVVSLEHSSSPRRFLELQERVLECPCDAHRRALGEFALESQHRFWQLAETDGCEICNGGVSHSKHQWRSLFRTYQVSGEIMGGGQATLPESLTGLRYVLGDVLKTGVAASQNFVGGFYRALFLWVLTAEEPFSWPLLNRPCGHHKGAVLGLPKGTAVEVVKGPLSGRRGVVVKAESRRERARLAVKNNGNRFEVWVSLSSLERVYNEPANI